MKLKKLLFAVYNWFVFFALAAFAVSCCMTLFLKLLSDTLGIEYTPENLSVAAKLTFGNVVLISLIFTAVDMLRRRLMVDRPTKRITEAGERIMQGDFGVRIAPLADTPANESFNSIIGCFNGMAQELGGVETLRTDFIANVSHEFKTPLAAVSNYAALLGGENLSEEKRLEYAAAVSQASRRMADMITNILKLNRLETRGVYPDLQEYDLGEQLCECLLQFESVWENGGIQLETDIADDIRITADAELLSLVWNNLLSNAFKFTEQGGTVSVSLHNDGDFAVVKVADSGCGMSAEVGAHIFEKFYQGDTSHSAEGNGLGLALVKRVIDIMHGEISVESALGEGTIFTVRIRRC